MTWGGALRLPSVYREVDRAFSHGGRPEGIGCNDS